MTLYRFDPTTIPIPFKGLLGQWHTDRGVTVWRQGGVWHSQSEPFWGNATSTGVKDADVVPVADRPGGERTDGTDRDRYLFFGGHVYRVSNAVANDLIAAGHTVTTDPGGPIGPGDPKTVDLLEGTVDSLTGTVDAL